jgi:hypothetical protein
MIESMDFIVHDLLAFGIHRGHLESSGYKRGQSIYQFIADEQSAEYITIVPERCRPIEGVTIIDKSILYDGTTVFLISLIPPATYKAAGGIFVSIEK